MLLFWLCCLCNYVCGCVNAIILGGWEEQWRHSLRAAFFQADLPCRQKYHCMSRRISTRAYWHGGRRRGRRGLWEDLMRTRNPFVCQMTRIRSAPAFSLFVNILSPNFAGLVMMVVDHTLEEQKVSNLKEDPKGKTLNNWEKDGIYIYHLLYEKLKLGWTERLSRKPGWTCKARTDLAICCSWLA